MCRRRANMGARGRVRVRVSRDARTEAYCMPTDTVRRLRFRASRRYTSFPTASPAAHQCCGDAELIANSCDDEIDQIADRRGAVVKPGAGRQHDGAGFGRPAHVVDLHQRQRRFARHENQFSPLLQMHFRRAVDQVAAHRMADRAQRAAGAGANDHAAGQKRAAGDRRQSDSDNGNNGFFPAGGRLRRAVARTDSARFVFDARTLAGSKSSRSTVNPNSSFSTALPAGLIDK